MIGFLKARRYVPSGARLKRLQTGESRSSDESLGNPAFGTVLAHVKCKFLLQQISIRLSHKNNLNVKNSNSKFRVLFFA